MIGIRGLLVGLLLGAAFFGSGLTTIVDHQLSVLNTTTVNGTVVESDVALVEDDVSDWVVKVTYRYEYDGETYRNNDYYPWGGPRVVETEVAAERIVADYEEGSTVTVHVQRNVPRSSHLVERDLPLGALLTVGMGVAIIGVTVLLYRR